jgi:hypothetical protein
MGSPTTMRGNKPGIALAVFQFLEATFSALGKFTPGVMVALIWELVL